MREPLVKTVERHLEAVVDGYPDRHVGGPGNIAAVEYAQSVFEQSGWVVDAVDFEALDCALGPATFSVEGRPFEVWPGPYTTPVDASAPLLAIETVEALAAADLHGAIVLLHGAIAADQLFPSSFDFVEAPEHRRIYQLLEDGEPAAVIGATGRGGGMGGGLYPYPLIEDGDFLVPNAYTTDVIGAQVARLAGTSARLVLVSERFRVDGRQLTAARGPLGAPRAVVIAHIDSKAGSPGALDNATGVSALLGVAGLLDDYDGPYRVELVPMNGEDYYANSGEHLFVAANEDRWEELLGAVNMDAIGARDARTALSMYAVSDQDRALIQRVLRRHDRVTLGEQWYESDHSIVAARGRPTVALTSTSFRELCASVTHTERDTLELVDPAEVAAAAEFVADLVRSLPAVGGPAA